LNYLGHPLYLTNLHTHGLHVTPGDNENGTHGDNMLVMLQPGEGTVYEYDLSKHYPGTLNFYHPHIHGSVSDQMWGGMAGCLVVEDEIASLAPYETHIMMLKDITLSGSEPAPHTSMMQYMHGLEGDTVMVNGQVNPRLYIKAGQVQRWRIVNSCTARFFRLSLSNHSMYLVGTEGGLLDKPYAVSEVLLSPGERVDLLIKASKSSGSYKFLSLPYSRMGNMGGQQVTLLTLTYSGRQNQSLPSVVDPEAKRVVMNTGSLPRKTLNLSMGQAAGYINGITFVDHEHCYTAMSMLGDWEVWEIINQSGMDHPFHHHVNAAQVLSITGGDANYSSLYTTVPAWKDVTIVPKWGKIELLMPVMDYMGMSMFHCHIIEHEDIGMMGMWHIM
ncbi:MAG: multicopper oxidase domain-containing protein, partial [Thermodesulfovibrionales bacterium]